MGLYGCMLLLKKACDWLIRFMMFSLLASHWSESLYSTNPTTSMSILPVFLANLELYLPTLDSTTAGPQCSNVIDQAANLRLKDFKGESFNPLTLPPPQRVPVVTVGTYSLVKSTSPSIISCHGWFYSYCYNVCIFLPDLCNSLRTMTNLLHN